MTSQPRSARRVGTAAAIFLLAAAPFPSSAEAQVVRANGSGRPGRPATGETRFSPETPRRTTSPIGPAPGPSPAPSASPSSSTSATDGPRTIQRPSRTISRPDKDAAATNRSPASPWWTILASTFVIGLIFVIARIWRTHGPGVVPGIPDEALELLGRRPLDSRQSLHLVRLGRKILVLGSSPDGLRTLTEIDDPVEVDYLAGMCRSARTEIPIGESFKAWFGRAIGGSTNESPEPAATDQRDSNPSTSAPASQTTSRDDGADDLRRRLAERLRAQPANHVAQEAPRG